MSNSKFYAIKDTKADYYQAPLLFRNNGEVIRALTNTLKTGDNNLANNPEDFQLYEVGEYDEQTGLIEALAGKKHIIDLIDLKPSSSENKL